MVNMALVFSISPTLYWLLCVGGKKKVRIWVHKYFQGSYLKDLQELKESKGQESTENYRKSPSQKRRETQAESITDFTSQIHRSCWGRTQRRHRSPYYSAFPLIKGSFSSQNTELKRKTHLILCQFFCLPVAATHMRRLVKRAVQDFFS